MCDARQNRSDLSYWPIWEGNDRRGSWFKSKTAVQCKTHGWETFNNVKVRITRQTQIIIIKKISHCCSSNNHVLTLLTGYSVDYAVQNLHHRVVFTSRASVDKLNNCKNICGYLLLNRSYSCYLWVTSNHNFFFSIWCTSSKLHEYKANDQTQWLLQSENSNHQVTLRTKTKNDQLWAYKTSCALCRCSCKQLLKKTHLHDPTHQCCVSANECIGGVMPIGLFNVRGKQTESEHVIAFKQYKWKCSTCVLVQPHRSLGDGAPRVCRLVFSEDRQQESLQIKFTHSWPPGANSSKQILH